MTKFNPLKKGACPLEEGEPSGGTMKPNLINRWIVPISGYTQHPEQRNGSSDLALSLHNNIGKAPGVWVHPVIPWKVNWKCIARKLQVNGVADVKVFIIAYSWGAGWGAVRLCEYLRQIGVEVEKLFLADPVFRSPYPWMRWTSRLTKNSMLSWFTPKIIIPSNVKEVAWTRQYNNWPQAHDLVAASPTTIIGIPYVEDNLVHNQMDESETFYNLVIEGVQP